MVLQAKVLTISDSVSQGASIDRSGPELSVALATHGFEVIELRVVPDGLIPVAEAITEMALAFRGLLISTGGTGFSPTDFTPEATLSLLHREAPGISEAMRLVNPLGRLNRGVAGTIDECLIINVPGSPPGAIESLNAVIDVIGHALDLLAGHRPH
jgi:molybdenum cofactor synthesis domain-containing protein